MKHSLDSNFSLLKLKENIAFMYNKCDNTEWSINTWTEFNLIVFKRLSWKRMKYLLKHSYSVITLISMHGI